MRDDKANCGDSRGEATSESPAGPAQEWLSLQRLLDRMPDGAYLADENYDLQYVNPVIEGSFGAPDGRKCYDYFCGRTEVCPWCRREEIERGEGFRWEWYSHKAGKHFKVTNVPLTSADGTRCRLDILHDITAQKQMELALRESEHFNEAIISSIGEGLIVYDRELRYRVWNRFMEELTGLSADEVLGKAALELFPHLREQGVDQLLERALEGETVLSPDLRYDVSSTGRKGWFVGLYSPHISAAGEIIGVVAVLRDLTDRKEAEEALRKSEQELQVRSRISSVFLSVRDDDMYAEVLRIVLEVMESKFGYFGYIDEQGSLVSPSLSRDVWSRCQIPDKSIVFPREKWSGLWGRSLEEKKTLFENGSLTVPEGHIPLSRALCVPILYRGGLVGQISVANRATDYTSRDVALLEEIANHIAPILFARLQRDSQIRARQVAEEALTRLRRQLKADRGFAGIIGRDVKMLELYETIREVAAVDVPVLIQGESGTGKELVASAIHSEGPRAREPFIPVNCSALPANLLESELFGHVKGAFTGAFRDKKGRFELADRGTIFLDEVGDLTPPIQVSLLRVLQEKTIERVGSEQSIRVDTRVVSASNKDLRKLVAAGKFREDLFYRLCVIPVVLPPLRERRDDIPLLASHILEQILAESGRAAAGLTLSDEVLDALMAHEWPGNVRELQNAIHYASVKCKGGALRVGHFPASVVGGARKPRAAGRRGRKPKLTLEEVKEALRETGDNRREAARQLGVSRATLYKYLERLQES